jgi:hypothetical protein
VRTVVLFLAVALASACGARTPSGPPAPVDERIVLAPGESSAIPEASISLRFDRVTGDSRCPADAVCIQGGDAVVHVTVTPADGARREYDLHTGDMQPVRHGDVTIALVELAPYPFSSRTIEPDEYRATLRVTR